MVILPAVLASLSSSLTNQVAAHGIYATFVLMAIDAILPAGSELVMLYAGAVAAGVTATKLALFGAQISSGPTAFLAVAAAGTLGYLAGAVLGWWIGRAGGRPLLEQHGSWFHLPQKRLDRAQRWFERWGQWSVLLGRNVPIARSFISIPAGVFGMPLGRYILLTLVGSAIWAFALAGAGYGLGTRYGHFDHAFRYAEYAVVLAVVGAAVVLVARAVRARD
jgi:membrane protein DedA with SNARE-associated domain